MPSVNRRQTPRVKDGRVQKKNNWELTPGRETRNPGEVVIERRRPGEGYRHLLLQRDVQTFLGILPGWDELAVGLNTIVLDKGDPDLDGFHLPRRVHLCAWRVELWIDHTEAHYRAHADIFAKLGVVCTPLRDEQEPFVRCEWTENTARAYQLIHILLHELGHHHDRMTTATQNESARGEPYAEAYARRYEELIWHRFLKEFELD